ncbi:aminotransferase class IV [Algoriphagus hitonicola]|uniref:branched-chain-amino-acid transaminase n=1 Tax=Algoriphagus hitonicola TaxID=435880 RepID=A0A1I2TUH5_9BACT|nr:aminotransferase class IV [Algoriphagus hitonicola]SFG68528.1 branched-chain amino acid aminotransferase [Algoriphagus hitonicola]
MSDFETGYFSEGNLGGWKLASDLPFPNRAMAFGDGLFETMVYDGEKIRFFDHHIDRLKNGMHLLGLDMSELNPEEILSLIHSVEPKRIKWTVYRAGAGKYYPENCKIHQVVQIAPLANIPDHNLRAVFSQRVFLTHSIISHCKTLNSLPYVLAALERKERGTDEIILLDSQGNVSEAGASNIYWARGENVYTPSLQSGCIAGVSRRVILRHFRESGIPVEEGLFKPQDLLQADRAWISNVTGIRYLKSIENTEYMDEPFPVLKRLF